MEVKEESDIERAYQKCLFIGGIFHHREHLIAQGQTEEAEDVSRKLRRLIKDFKVWLEKAEI
jgi:hypothetical protein